MDGAAKFVRGDAIAGLLIVFINVIGGIIIGTVQEDMSLGDAASTYTILTIGDGLVSQVPALIVSISAGLLVSKAGVEGTADQALLDQFTRHPKAMAMTAGLNVGSCACAFRPISAPSHSSPEILGGISYMSWQRQEIIKQEKAQALLPATRHRRRTPCRRTNIQSPRNGYHPPRTRLWIVVIGARRRRQQTHRSNQGPASSTRRRHGLRASCRTNSGQPATPRKFLLRKNKEIEAGRGDVRAGMLMCMDPTGAPITLPGENTVEPTFGLPAMWIDEQFREEAHFKGYTVVDAPTVITTHITELVKDNMADLLSYAETQKLLDELPKEYQKLVGDVIPSHMTVGGLQRILQNLVSERVSVRDLPTILEGISEPLPTPKTSRTSQNTYAPVSHDKSAI